MSFIIFIHRVIYKCQHHRCHHHHHHHPSSSFSSSSLTPLLSNSNGVGFYEEKENNNSTATVTDNTTSSSSSFSSFSSSSSSSSSSSLPYYITDATFDEISKKFSGPELRTLCNYYLPPDSVPDNSSGTKFVYAIKDNPKMKTYNILFSYLA